MANVLEFPGTSLRLEQLVGGGGKGVLGEWLASEHQARARFRVRVLNLARTSKTDWNKTQFQKIEEDLFELKWKANNKQYRALGYYSEDGCFVVVHGCTHQGKVYHPANWKNTALSRIREAKQGLWRMEPYEP